MTQEEFDNLRVGDLVQSKFSCENYMVQCTTSIGEGRVVIRTLEIFHPDEWDLICKADYEIMRKN